VASRRRGGDNTSTSCDKKHDACYHLRLGWTRPGREPWHQLIKDQEDAMRTLVLNAGFEPLAVVSDHRAVVLVLHARASVLEEAEDPLTSPGGSYARPTVILLNRYVRPGRRRRVAVSRRAVLRRDGHRCGYCGDHADTVDHIRPRSKGGDTSWANLVACCGACNSRKADRELQELGWTLRTQPREPAHHVRGTWDGPEHPDEAWMAYLYPQAA
jgi:5-methylcytosine-specific restriction endonuclease McrA